MILCIVVVKLQLSQPSKAPDTMLVGSEFMEEERKGGRGKSGWQAIKIKKGRAEAAERNEIVSWLPFISS